MKPRTLVASQFAVLMFFLGWMVPFAGDILLPVVWIYDKRVFFIYLLIDGIDILRVMPGAIYITQGLPYLNASKSLFHYGVVPVIPAVLGSITLSATFTTWMGAWWLKRKIRKKAPDILRAIS